MKDSFNKIKHTNLLMAGFAFFFLGTTLITNLREEILFQILGLISMLIASALFGASIRSANQENGKKK